MNEIGFNVGNGAEGREKCRQKFSNLQGSHVKTLEKQKSTGKEQVKLPPYFEEVYEILGENTK